MFLDFTNCEYHYLDKLETKYYTDRAVPHPRVHYKPTSLMTKNKTVHDPWMNLQRFLVNVVINYRKLLIGSPPPKKKKKKKKRYKGLDDC